MANYGGLTKQMDAAAGIGRNAASKHKIQPKYRDEQADAGRDRRNRFARPNSQAPKGIGKYLCSVDHEQGWQSYPVDIYSCYR